MAPHTLNLRSDTKKDFSRNQVVSLQVLRKSQNRLQFIYHLNLAVATLLYLISFHDQTIDFYLLYLLLPLPGPRP